MGEKYLLFSLDDEKSKRLGEVISNLSCKKIINLLAEKELSESEIARELAMPVNTVEYNLRKLLEAGVIEKAKHWWSSKGRKMETYRAANKMIVISPKKTVGSKIKSIVPAFAIAVIATFLVYLIYGMTSNPASSTLSKSADFYENAPSAVSSAGASAASSMSQYSQFLGAWWFLVGAIIAIIALVVWNWKKL